MQLVSAQQCSAFAATVYIRSQTQCFPQDERCAPQAAASVEKLCVHTHTSKMH